MFKESIIGAIYLLALMIAVPYIPDAFLFPIGIVVFALTSYVLGCIVCGWTLTRQ